MKKSFRYQLLFCILVLTVQTGTVNAQFFKDILNTVKQTANSRANSKTSQTTNNALDKVDPSTQKKSTNSDATLNGLIDTNDSHSVLGAFAKAAAANPNDTSSADLTMKALNIMVGGNPISAKDSAVIINSFKTSDGGSGVHYQTRTTVSGKKMAPKMDTSQIYFTNNGEGRGEMVIPMPGASASPMISIYRAKAPNSTIMLYPESKTYSLQRIDTALLNRSGNYQISRIGTETVGGYSCIHVKMTSTTGSGVFKSTNTEDVWTSTAVPGYSIYRNIMPAQTAQSGMYGALDKAGCAGYIVKLELTGKDYTVQMLLIKAEQGNFSADLFKIPSNYTLSSEGMMYHMMTPKK